MTFVGGDGNDSILGLSDNDSIIGGLGANTLIGGSGNTAYYITSSSDTVIDSGGNDTITTTLNNFSLANSRIAGGNSIENLVFAGVGNARLEGNVLANSLISGDGNDTLGTPGVVFINDDTLIGGKGSDLYYVNTRGTKVIELSNEGIDTVVANIDGYTLADNVERLILDGVYSGVRTGIGNNSSNTISGNNYYGKYKLIGGGGADFIYGGGAGNVTLIGGTNKQFLERSIPISPKTPFWAAQATTFLTEERELTP